MYLLGKIASIMWFLLGGYFFFTSEDIHDPQIILSVGLIALAYLASIDAEFEKMRKDRKI